MVIESFSVARAESVNLNSFETSDGCVGFPAVYFLPNFHRQDLGVRTTFPAVMFFYCPIFKTFPTFINLFHRPISKLFLLVSVYFIAQFSRLGGTHHSLCFFQRAWLLLAAVFIFWLLSLLTDWDPGFREKMPNCNPTSDLDDSKILLCKWIDVQPAKRIAFDTFTWDAAYIILFHLRNIKC